MSCNIIFLIIIISTIGFLQVEEGAAQYIQTLVDPRVCVLIVT